MSTAHHLVALIRERRLRAPKQPSYRALHSIADRSVPSVRAIFRRAVAETKKDTITARLEAALAHHARESAYMAIAWGDVGAKILERRLTEKFLRIIVAAGTAAQRHQPPGLELRLGVRQDDKEALARPPDVSLIFNASNPEAIKAALEKSAELVMSISEETRTGIRNSIARAIDEGRPPRIAAKDIRDMIGLNARQQQSIDSMRDDGASDLEIAKATREALNYRAEMIARTETMRASNLGQRALWDVADEAGLIDATATREFVATPDERECPVCAGLDGKTFGLDEPIHTDFGDVTEPPVHPNCRCVMVLNIR